MKVLLCSFFKFPNGCAGAVRHEKFSQMLLSLGHDVKVVGIGKSNNFQTDVYKGINYVSLRYGSTKLNDKIKTALKFWTNLKKIIQEYKPECIIMDDLRPIITIKLKKYSRKYNFMLIHDSVEWYSKEQFKFGFFSPSLINKNIVNRFLIDKSCRVIAISKYLEKYYVSKGIKCVNIPIVVSKDDFVYEKNFQDTINITYAGQIGKKDNITVVLQAMNLLTDDEKKKVEFNILGCSIEAMLKNGFSSEMIKNLGVSLKVYGRVSREQVFEVLKRSDFTVLVRAENQRYSKAGFPTKVVESLSHSTPVIANITSDLDRYLLDGYNSLIIDNCTPEDIVSVLRKAISLSADERKQMCENASKVALEKLCWEVFIPELIKILN